MDNQSCGNTISCGQCESSPCSKLDINTLSQIRNDIFLLRKNITILFESLLGLSNCNNVGELVQNQLKILQNALFNLSCYIDNFNSDCYRCSPCQDFFVLNKALAILADIKQNLCNLQSRGLTDTTTSCGIILRGENFEINLILATQYIDETIQDHVCYTVE